MAHESIEPADHGPYYEGDYLDIPHTVVDQDEIAVDLTGANVEFFVKHELTDGDEEALLTKSGQEANPNNEVTFDDPANGECTIHIETEDTNGFLTDNDIRVSEETFEFVIRVTDSDGRRVSTATGEWSIHAT